MSLEFLIMQYPTDCTFLGSSG